MNVKHSMMFGLVSRLVSYVDSWSQQGRKQGAAWWKHRKRRQEDVKRTLLQMSLRPFQHFLKCGGGYSRCSGSCHFLSHPLTFGILGCLPCVAQEVGWRTGVFSISQGHSGRDGSGQSLWPHHHSSTRWYNCNLTQCFPL